MLFSSKPRMCHVLACLVGASIFSCSSNEEEPAASDLAVISTPVETADHNRQYLYKVFFESSAREEVVIEVERKPNWLDFDADDGSLKGIPGWANLNNSFKVILSVADGLQTIKQEFDITVRLGEILCGTSPGDPSESPYVLPYPVGEEVKLIQSNCPSNPNWGHHNWFAYDFETLVGDSILAARAGTVIATVENNPDVSDCSGGKENFVFILHEDGSVMTYVHLQQHGVAVQVDDVVQQGQFLGYSGNSGCTGTPHLHLALFLRRGNYNRQYTLPINFSNAEGELDRNNTLVHNAWYKALRY